MLFINHENFLNNLIEALLEPIEVVRQHLGNDGLTEGSHKKFLEI
jgi:hypothetical protein